MTDLNAYCIVFTAFIIRGWKYDICLSLGFFGMEKWSTGKIGKAFSLDFKWPVIGYGLDKVGWHRKADIWGEEKEWYQFILILVQPVAPLLFLRLTKFGRTTLNLCCCTIIKTLVVLNTVDVCVYSFLFFLDSFSKCIFKWQMFSGYLNLGSFNHLWITVATSNLSCLIALTK